MFCIYGIFACSSDQPSTQQRYIFLYIIDREGKERMSYNYEIQKIFDIFYAIDHLSKYCYNASFDMAYLKLRKKLLIHYFITLMLYSIREMIVWLLAVSQILCHVIIKSLEPL